jgi:hypothetical protein
VIQVGKLIILYSENLTRKLLNFISKTTFLIEDTGLPGDGSTNPGAETRKVRKFKCRYKKLRRSRKFFYILSDIVKIVSFFIFH